MLSPGVGDGDEVPVGFGVELAYESDDAAADTAPMNETPTQNTATTMTVRSVNFRRDGTESVIRGS